MQLPVPPLIPAPTNNNITGASPLSSLQETISQNSTSPPVPLPSSNGTLDTGMTSTSENSTYVTVQLIPDTSSLFFECNQTTVNGSSTLPGLNVTASTIQVLTDGHANTQLLGNVTFDINFEKPFKDKPE